MKYSAFNLLFSLAYFNTCRGKKIYQNAPIINTYVFNDKFDDALLYLDATKFEAKLSEVIERKEALKRIYLEIVISKILKDKYISELGTKANYKKIKKYILTNVESAARKVVFGQIDNKTLMNVVEYFRG